MRRAQIVQQGNTDRFLVTIAGRGELCRMDLDLDAAIDYLRELQAQGF